MPNSRGAQYSAIKPVFSGKGCSLELRMDVCAQLYSMNDVLLRACMVSYAS
jgi:hypothetical protein